MGHVRKPGPSNGRAKKLGASFGDGIVEIIMGNLFKFFFSSKLARLAVGALQIHLAARGSSVVVPMPKLIGSLRLARRPTKITVLVLLHLAVSLVLEIQLSSRYVRPALGPSAARNQLGRLGGPLFFELFQLPGQSLLKIRTKRTYQY